MSVKCAKRVLTLRDPWADDKDEALSVHTIRSWRGNGTRHAMREQAVADLFDYVEVLYSKEMGIPLTECTTEEIEEAVKKIYGASDEELRQMLGRSQEFALRTFSREEFSKGIACVPSGLLW